MEEIYEVIKSTGSTVKVNTEISNKANVRIKAYVGDKEIACYYLSLGKGLYVRFEDNYPTICICGTAGEIYRYVYFMQYTGHKYIKGYQIHHLDYNHCNNDIDNLIYCSPIEHGIYHKWQGYLEDGCEQQGRELYGELFDIRLEQYNKAIKLYKWLEYNKDIFSIDKSKEYIHSIRNEIKQKAKPYLEQYKKEKQIQKQIQKQQKIDTLVSTGNYYLDDNGKLHKKRGKWTAERRERTMKTRFNTMYNNPEWRQHNSEGLKQYYINNPEACKEISDRMKSYYASKRD